MNEITVTYHRPGKDTRMWKQELLADEKDMIVSAFTFRLKKPFSPFDIILIENGFSGIMFDLMNEWYNVVKVFDENDEFVGYYTDIRTPPERTNKGYRAEDLFLDLWIYPDNSYHILDEDEFEESNISESKKEMALDTLDKLKEMIEGKKYPPKKIDNISE
ncbi:MAG: DUF402 domain-containing protein [Thermoplasmata archaeon]